MSQLGYLTGVTVPGGWYAASSPGLSAAHAGLALRPVGVCLAGLSLLAAASAASAMTRQPSTVDTQPVDA